MGFRLASAAACSRGSAKTLALAAASAAAAAALTSPPPLAPAPTKTLLFPARRHSSTTPKTSPWVILGSIPRVAEIEAGAGRAPARVAPVHLQARLPGPPHAAELPVPARHGPLGPAPPLRDPRRPAHPRRHRRPGRQQVLLLARLRPDFVLDAATGSALRLPDPGPQENVEHQALLGLLACPGGGDRYVVAELLPLIGGDTADLRCYYSDVGKWVTKSVRYPLPPRPLAPLRTLALHGRLWWADYSWGVLTADPFADNPVLGFVPLPHGYSNNY